jgi:hypothetical protein
VECGRRFSLGFVRKIEAEIFNASLSCLDTGEVARYAASSMSKLTGPDNPIKALREDFRRHLEIFYARLKLAPPYDSVEKAIKTLGAILTAVPAEEQARVFSNADLAWAHYRQAFIDSGLYLKHRGIISGLVRSGQTANFPPEYAALLEAYGSTDGSDSTPHRS